MKAPTAALVVSGVLVAGVLAWGIDRGFDITDEAVYLIESSRPSRPGFTHFGYVVHAAFLGTAPTIIQSRVARLVAMLVASLVFGLGVHAWVRAVLPAIAERFRRIDAVAVSWLGSSLAWAFGPQSLSYNTLTAVPLLLAAAGVLRWLSRDADGRARRAASMDLVLAGASVALAFFVKAPAGALLGLLTAACVVVASPWRSALSALLRVAAGFAGAAALFFLVACPADVWMADVLFAARAGNEVGHGLRGLVGAALRNASAVGGWLLVEYGVPIALVAAFVVAWRRFPRLARSQSAGRAFVVVGAVAFAAAICVSRGWSAGRLDVRVTISAYLALAAAVALSAFAGSTAAPADGGHAVRRTELRAGWAILLAVPAIGIAGTNLEPSHLFFLYATAWVTAIVLFAAWASARTGPWLYVLTSVAVGALVACHVATGFVLAPNTLRRTSLLDQTVPVTGLERLRGIRLEPARAEFFERVAAALGTSSADGRPPGVIAFHDLAGVVWATEQGPIEVAALFGRFPARTRRMLSQVPASELRTCWVLVATKRAFAGPDILRSFGLQFPDGYTRVAQIPDPYYDGLIEVWRPNVR